MSSSFSEIQHPVFINSEHAKYLIDISAIAELGKMEEKDSGIFVGAAVTIQELR